MRLQDYATGTTYQARVLASTRITPEGVDEVRELRLVVAQPDFDCQAGQSVGVIVPGPHAMGHPHHFRLYSVADTVHRNRRGQAEIKLCVKRCTYIDEYSGEVYRGIASNYLCDLSAGDNLILNGPHGLPFEIPEDKTADLLLIGMGTGIAPFRAFIKKLYREEKGWRGRVWLFYGARSGLESLYMNRENDDLGHYFDRETFRAFHAFSPRPHWGTPIALDASLEARAEEILAMLTGSGSYIYVAGRREIRETLDRVFSQLMGSEAAWQARLAELEADRRWVELIY